MQENLATSSEGLIQQPDQSRKEKLSQFFNRIKEALRDRFIGQHKADASLATSSPRVENNSLPPLISPENTRVVNLLEASENDPVFQLNEEATATIIACVQQLIENNIHTYEGNVLRIHSLEHHLSDSSNGDRKISLTEKGYSLWPTVERVDLISTRFSANSEPEIKFRVQLRFVADVSKIPTSEDEVKPLVLNINIGRSIAMRDITVEYPDLRDKSLTYIEPEVLIPGKELHQQLAPQE